MTKELHQFNKYGVFEPKRMSDLPEEDKKKALLLLILLKEKKSGAIKAMSCTNGNPQREHIHRQGDLIQSS